MTLIPGWKRREFLKVGTTTTVAVAAGAIRARARETETSGGHRHVATRRHDARGGDGRARGPDGAQPLPRAPGPCAVLRPESVGLIHDLPGAADVVRAVLDEARTVLRSLSSDVTVG